MEQNHLSAAEIAAFIDRSLEGEVRVRAVEHLATCERCRDEVATCARLAASAPATTRIPVALRAAAGIAAALVLAVAVRSSWHGETPVSGARTATVERSAPIIGRITTVFPTDSVTITRSQLRFVWRQDEDANVYRFVVTDANGRVVWRRDITDTAFALPDTVRLTRSALYYWHVDAPHADGSSAQSSGIAFRVAP